MASNCPGFAPKRPTGPLAKRCAHCNEHIEAHNPRLREELECLQCEEQIVLEKGKHEWRVVDKDDPCFSAEHRLEHEQTTKQKLGESYQNVMTQEVITR